MTFTRIVNLFLFVFGLVTIFAGGSVIFDLFGFREREGQYILFIVWANFICGFLYLIAGVGWLKGRQWATVVMLSAALILVFAFGAMLIVISGGQPYENKTLGAMVFRTALTLGILVFMRRSLKGSDPKR